MKSIKELESELMETKAELTAANLTISNIQNALGLPGKKGISAEVIDLVNGVAGNTTTIDIAEIKAQTVMDAIDAVSLSGALTLADGVVALAVCSANLREGKA